MLELVELVGLEGVVLRENAQDKLHIWMPPT